MGAQRTLRLPYRRLTIAKFIRHKLKFVRKCRPSLGPSRERAIPLDLHGDGAPVGFSPPGRGIAYPAPKPPQRLYP